jgi:hypothetical protein
MLEGSMKPGDFDEDYITLILNQELKGEMPLINRLGN